MSQALPAIPPTTPFRPTPVWQRIFAYRQEKLRQMFAPELKPIPCK